MKTTAELLADVAVRGGAIVSSADCSKHERAGARSRGDFAVLDGSLGFVRRSKEWLDACKRYRQQRNDLLQVAKDSLRVMQEEGSFEWSLQCDTLAAITDSVQPKGGE